MSRIGVVAVSLLSLYFALNRNSTIQEAVLYAWSGLGCAFGPLMLMSLYSKKANKYGAIAGVVVGGLIAGLWHLVNPYVTSYVIPAMTPGFFLSLLEHLPRLKIYPYNTNSIKETQRHREKITG